MEMLISKEYVLPNPNKNELKNYGLHYNKLMSDSECDFYSIRFPALQYHKTTTVDGEIIINMNSGNVKINAYNYGTDNYYPHFIKKIVVKYMSQLLKKLIRGLIQCSERSALWKLKKVSD